jgi:hypothetical protein
MTNGIFTPEQAKTEHHTSRRLAVELTKILPSNRPIIDYGCGKGEYIARLSALGFKCTGYEGTKGIEELAAFKGIIQADLTKPLGKRPKGSVLCLEVAEHIDQKHEDTFIQNITENCTGRLILSWAIKGQGGCGHVNEQDSDYVIPRIEKEGFELNGHLSNHLRGHAGADLWWFKNSIYVFDRKG